MQWQHLAAPLPLARRLIHLHKLSGVSATGCAPEDEVPALDWLLLTLAGEDLPDMPKRSMVFFNKPWMMEFRVMAACGFRPS